MKTGRDIVEMAREIQRQSKAKKDLIADTRQVEAVLAGEDGALSPKFHVEGQGEFAIQPQAHRQVAKRSGIPKRYYDHMLEAAPELWAHDVNYWNQHEPKQRMLRTLDGQVRAELSRGYRPLDNDELFQAAFPALNARGVEIVSSEITETKLYVKFIDPSITAFVKGSGQFASERERDAFTFGGIITNSEVGKGTLSVKEFMVRQVCTNGMIGTSVMRQVHVGGEANETDGVYYRDDTRQASDKALFLKLRDNVESLLTQERADAVAAKFSATTENEVPNPIKAVEVVAKNKGFTEDEQNDVLTNLIKAGDLSQWGLANAVTRAAEDRPDYDRATEFESMGMEIIDLTPNQWREVAVA